MFIKDIQWFDNILQAFKGDPFKRIPGKMKNFYQDLRLFNLVVMKHEVCQLPNLPV